MFVPATSSNLKLYGRLWQSVHLHVCASPKTLQWRFYSYDLMHFFVPYSLTFLYLNIKHSKVLNDAFEVLSGYLKYDQFRKNRRKCIDVSIISRTHHPGCCTTWPHFTGVWRMSLRGQWTVWRVLCISLPGTIAVAYQHISLVHRYVSHTQCFTGVLILTLCVFFNRQHKDVALVNLANILHRAHFSADAAILAHAALDLTSDLFTSHYTLGNIYAVR